MKLIKTSSGKQTIKISKSDWEAIGKQANWDLPDPSWHGGPPEYGPAEPPLHSEVLKYVDKVLTFNEYEEGIKNFFDDKYVDEILEDYDKFFEKVILENSRVGKKNIAEFGKYLHDVVLEKVLEEYPSYGSDMAGEAVSEIVTKWLYLDKDQEIKSMYENLMSGRGDLS